MSLQHGISAKPKDSEKKKLSFQDPQSQFPLFLAAKDLKGFDHLQHEGMTDSCQQLAFFLHLFGHLQKVLKNKSAESMELEGFTPTFPASPNEAKRLPIDLLNALQSISGARLYMRFKAYLALVFTCSTIRTDPNEPTPILRTCLATGEFARRCFWSDFQVWGLTLLICTTNRHFHKSQILQKVPSSLSMDAPWRIG